MLTTMIIGKKIAQARKHKNLSQVQLALQLSISSQAVGKWERGESMPDILTFNRLAEILEVDLNYFSENFPSHVVQDQTDQTIVEPTEDRPTEEMAVERKMIQSIREPVRKPGWNMSQGNWVDADFSGLSNIREQFSSSNINNCLFIGSDLTGLLLKDNNVVRSDFSNADLSESQIVSSSILSCQFNHCSLRESHLSASYIKGCDFIGADFSGMEINACSWQKNITTGAIWNRIAFKNSAFTDVVFEGALMDCSFDSCEFARVTFQNVTLTDTFFKCKSLKKIRFIECKADRITYAFLKNGKANMSGIELFTPEGGTVL